RPPPGGKATTARAALASEQHRPPRDPLEKSAAGQRAPPEHPPAAIGGLGTGSPGPRRKPRRRTRPFREMTTGIEPVELRSICLTLEPRLARSPRGARWCARREWPRCAARSRRLDQDRNAEPACERSARTGARRRAARRRWGSAPRDPSPGIEAP